LIFGHQEVTIKGNFLFENDYKEYCDKNVKH